MPPLLVDAPKVAPVSIADVKAHLRIDHGDEDPVLEGYIAAATQYLESPDGILDKILVEQTWRQDYPVFATPLPLPLAPVLSVTTITYYDAMNVLQTLPPQSYSLVPNRSCPYVLPAAGSSWPATYIRFDAVSVKFVAGYGDANAVPAPIRQAMLVLIGDWYANRENSSGTEMIELPYAARALLMNYRRPVM